MIFLESVHDMKSVPEKRYLIDRKWPRGITRFIPHKEKSGASRRALAPIVWRPSLAPGPRLAQWYYRHREVDQFRHKYFTELRRKEKEWMPIAREAKNGITLLYRKDGISLLAAVVFRDFLELELKSGLPEAPRGRRPAPAGRGVIVPSVEKAESRRRSRPPESRNGA